MKPRKNLIFLASVASIVPLSYFIFPFLVGFCNLSQGYLMLLIPIDLFGSIAASIVVAMRVPVASKASRAGLGILTWVAMVGLFVIFPPGAKSWTLGLATNFRLTKQPMKIQTWVTGVLDRYEAGQLSTSTNAPYWGVGKETVNNSEIPTQIGNLWQAKPSITIVTFASDGSMSGNSRADVELSATAGKPIRCVAFSWYLTGILVGRPDFRTEWNPWYIHEIMPGIYAYSGMK